MFRKLIPKIVRKKLYQLLYPKSPVLWANWGALSEYLASKIRPVSPPVVILSMPRSGSSWVGEILRLSPNGMYLREPITQTHLKNVETGSPSFFEFNPLNPPTQYQIAGNNVFMGLPLFDSWIIKYPKQWKLSGRRRKRIIVKEVNPFMLKWLMQEFQPKIIFLLRHPVAVADSFSRMGWKGKQFEFRIKPRTLEQKVPDYGQFTYSFWAEHGALQGFILKEVLDKFGNHPNFKLIKYEQLCEAPIDTFKELYQFAELEWNDSVEKQVLKYTCPEEVNSHDYSVHRNSHFEMNKWKTQVSANHINELKVSYLSFELPYYKSDWPV